MIISYINNWTDIKSEYINLSNSISLKYWNLIRCPLISCRFGAYRVSDQIFDLFIVLQTKFSIFQNSRETHRSLRSRENLIKIPNGKTVWGPILAYVTFESNLIVWPLLTIGNHWLVYLLINFSTLTVQWICKYIDFDTPT